MAILITKVTLNAVEHRTAIFTLHLPSWFQRVFLRMKKGRVTYMGSGTKWVDWDTQKPPRRYIAERLQVEEVIYKIQRKKKRR